MNELINKHAELEGGKESLTTLGCEVRSLNNGLSICFKWPC